MKTVDDYLALIPPEHQNKPDFAAMVTWGVAPYVAMQASAAGLVDDFDLDDAVGPQLDAVGVRVGISRNVPVPIVNAFFSFGDAARGWGLGFWKGPGSQQFGIQSFDDETYRRLLRAKIIANSGDGSAASAKLILDTFLVGTGAVYSVTVSDGGDGATSNCPMKMTVAFSGTLPSLVYMLVVSQELLPIRASGVKLNVAGTTVSGSPVFGFGVNNQYIAGWGTGAWGREPNYLAQQ